MLDCLGHLIVYGIIFLVGLGLIVFGVMNILEITDPTVVARVRESVDMREPFDAYFLNGTNVPPKYGDAHGYCKNLSVCDAPLNEKDECVGNEYEIPYCDQECQTRRGKSLGKFWVTKHAYQDSIGKVENTGKEKGAVYYGAVCHNGPGLPRKEDKTNKCDVLLDYEFGGKDFSSRYHFDSSVSCSETFPVNSDIKMRFNPKKSELTPMSKKTSEHKGYIFIGIGVVVILVTLPSLLKSFTKTGCEQLKKESLIKLQVAGGIMEAAAYGLARGGGDFGGGGDDGVGAPSM